MFFRNNHFCPRSFQGKSVIPTQRATKEAKRLGEQQRLDLEGHQNECKFPVYKIVGQKVSISRAKWVWAIWGPNNNYYKETIVFNKNNHFIPGTIRYILYTSDTSYGNSRPMPSPTFRVNRVCDLIGTFWLN